MRKSRARRLLPLLAASALVVAACGDDDDDSSGSEDTTEAEGGDEAAEAEGGDEAAEAEGGDDMRALEQQIGQTVYLSDRWVAGSPTLDCLPGARWTWWHAHLLVSRDAPTGVSGGPGPFTEALALAQENQERRARRIR